MNAGRRQAITRRVCALLAVAAFATACAGDGDSSGGRPLADLQTDNRPGAVQPGDGQRDVGPPTRDDGAEQRRAPAQPLEPLDSHELTTTADDRWSTFALDVDTGSYNLARAALRRGALPDPTQVRIEEFVNAIDQGYRSPAADEAFAITADATAWPDTVTTDRRLVRIGLSTAHVAGERLPAALTFVVDTSGSMDAAERLDLVREALHLLVDNLRPDDTVALVTYSDAAEVLLQPTAASQADLINDAISNLRPDGSTNLAAGLQLGYSLAREAMRPGGINRVMASFSQ